MTKEKPTEPRLRFPGFTDAWKQRKLGEVVERVSQKNLDRQYVETFTNSAEFGIISQRDFFEKNISSLENLSGYYVVNPDDFVYNPRISNLAPVGPIKRNKLGRVGVMSPLYTIFKFTDMNLDFVEKYFDTTIWHRYMELNGDSGARSDRFAIKDSVFRGLPIPHPSLPEQEAIGSFFSDLDQLITLHQRKLDSVKEMKKALLQKMFPKGNGNDFPELRFPEFTDAWKQRKLGELATFAKGNGYSKKDLVAEGAPIILYGRLYTKYETIISEIDTFVSVEENKNSVVYSEGGEVLVPASGESSLDIARASVVAEKGIILGGDLNIVRLHSEIFPVYLAVTISNGKQQKDLSKRAQGKSVVHLHNSDLKEVDLNFPTLPEQEAIGSFFSDLDQLITLHQRQLDHLKLLKKALLQQMFI
ncbi:TPA: restriction endonuclease subunit S [Streptococcus suis]